MFALSRIARPGKIFARRRSNPLSAPNYWTISLGELRDLLVGLRHAGVHEITTDSDGQIIGEKDHHYLGCKRCLIEEIIAARQ